MQDATETRINMVYENKILKKPSTLINKILFVYPEMEITAQQLKEWYSRTART